jgi:hypothetical protein
VTGGSAVRTVVLPAHARPGRLTAGQLYWLLLLTIFPTAVLVLPGDIVRAAGRWAWWSPLVGAVAGRRGGVVGAARRGLGVGWARLPLALAWAGAALVAVEAAREFAEVTETLFVLGQVPTWLLTAAGLIPAAWLARLGPVVLARVAGLLVLPLAVGFALVTAGAAAGGHVLWGLPLWPRDLRFCGWPAAGRAWAWLAAPAWVVALLAGHLDGPARRRTGTVAALATLSGALGLAVALWVMIIDGGPARISQFLLPFLNIADGLSVGPFAQHVGTLIMPVEVMGQLLRLGTALWAWTHLAAALGLRGPAVPAVQALLAGAAGLAAFSNMPALTFAVYRWMGPVVLPALAGTVLGTYAAADLARGRGRA